MKKFTEFIAEDVFKKHQLAIAKKTLKMPDAMVGVMGGPSKEEARKILQASDKSRHEAKKFAKSHKFTLRGLYKEETQNNESIEKEHAMKKFAEFLPEGFKQYLGYSKERLSGKTLTPVQQAQKERKERNKAFGDKIRQGGKNGPVTPAHPSHTNEEVQLDEISAKLAASAGRGRLKQGQALQNTLSLFQPGARLKTGPRAASRRVLQKAADVAFGKSKKNFEYAFKKNVKEEVQLDETMTRKHFQQVADVIKAHPDADKRAELAKHHATIFKASNPRFDHKRFYAAAGVDAKDVK